MGKERSLCLNNTAFFNNREISWLAFNKRVLQEAIDERNPLFERLKFISIFSTNLDEFFMVRVAGLKDQVKANFTKPENKSGLTPKEQLKEISVFCHQLVNLQDELFTNSVMPRLKEEGIEFLSFQELTHKQFSFLSKHFDEYILPILTPLAIHANRPFPKIMNKSLNLAVVLTSEEQPSKRKLAIVQVPTVIDRFVPLPSTHPKDKCFIFLEDVMAHFIHRIFSGHKILSISPFRITRNADLSIHEEDAEDLLKEIEKELKKRKWGAAVRLEISHSMDENGKEFLKDILELKEADVYTIHGRIDYSFFSKFSDHFKKDYPHHFHEPITPQISMDSLGEESIFDVLEKQDLFFHHPYDSFEPIVHMLQAAAKDPQVLAIKQTLYRVSGNSPIIHALVEAAENGKQVTVLVELKARFDEESNLKWAKTLEKAGALVIYGLPGLKTHSKILLIVRSEQDGKLQRFVHLGTGNYNEKTAQLYTDMGYLTAKETFGRDATNFFNHLSGYSHKPRYNEIVTAPIELRDFFLKLIDKEIENEEKYKNGHIIAKMNSLTDKPIILKLYEASCKGVKIDLIVRGICCLKPGIKGVSENITVRSIIDRFLEHSRIFYFYENGNEDVYLSSADWMTRNMDRRIEILFPIHDKPIKENVIDVLRITLKDNIKARIQQENGEYKYADFKEGDIPLQSQQYFYRHTINEK